MDLEVDRRSDSALRCASCHDHIAGARHACARCGSVQHVDCRADLGRCPTLGCGVADIVRPTPAGRSRWSWLPRRWSGSWVALRVALCGIVLLGMSSFGVTGRTGGLSTFAGPAVDPTTFNAPGWIQALVGTLRPGPGRSPCRIRVQLEQPVMTPGGAWACIDTDDPEGAPLPQLVFSLGRIRCDSVDIIPYPDGSGRDALKLTTAPDMGPDIGAEYYALASERTWVLVRLERADGRLAAELGYVDARIGPALRARSSDAEWTAALRSDDPVVVLEALGWMRHLAAADPLRLRSYAATLAALRALRSSADPWIAEAAWACLAESHDPFGE
jgi:hypothetical protein